MEQPETTYSFGYWVRRRRMAMDLTQAALARVVNCARVTIVKIERDERHPSRQMANLLADSLAIPADQRDQFLAAALGERNVDQIPLTSEPLEPQVTSSKPPPNHSGTAAVAARNTNLPAPLTTFVGRTQELAEITQAVSDHRLVTLIGAGGVGKTRLAIEAGIRLVWDGRHGAFADGVWVAELAPLASGRIDMAPNATVVAQAIANLFKLTVPVGRTTLDVLQEKLAPRHMLLILDNCEHLVQGCAEVAETLLHSCWQLHILATSREELLIPGEAVYPVLPLALPDTQESIPVRILSTPAAQLFVERMGQAPSLRHMREGDAVAIAHICRQLDGIPLALELAAPLTRSLSLAQIAAQLHDQMAILINSYRTSIPRHQTMHNALVWSYRLLSPSEQLLLAAVSVFAGGWTLEACQAICATTAESVQTALHQLVAKSFVLVESVNGARRYRLLEPIRQFAYRQLAASGDPAATRRRHAEYYLSMAEQLASGQDTPQERELLQDLAAERDNLRAVNEWAIEHNEAEFAQRFNGLLFAYWIYCSSQKEANYWLEAALGLQHRGDPVTRSETSLSAEALALNTAGYAALSSPDYARALAHFERELTLRRQIGDQIGIAATLRGIGFAAMHSGDLAKAQAYTEQAVSISQAAGDIWGVAWGQFDLGYLALVRGQLSTAQSLLEASLLPLRAQGVNFGVFRALLALGRVMKARREFVQARQYYSAALHLQQSMHYVTHLADGLEELGGIAAQEGRPAQAIRIFAAAHRYRETVATPRFRHLEADYERDVETARRQLEPEAWSANWELGSAMTVDEAVVLALAD